MSDVPVIPLVDIGLGNSTYLVDLGDGRAMAVDPSRDLRGVQAAAATRGLRVVYGAETHLHADFVSGSVQLAANGAQVLAADHLAELPAGPLVVMCGHGERAMSAASILQRAGRTGVAVLDGGPADWMQAAGCGLEAGR